MTPTIARAHGKELEAALPALAEMMREAIAGGAGLGYAEVPSPAVALEAWRGWARETEAGHRVILLARDADDIIGTVQLDLARVANAGHRAELGKLIVRADRRGRGLGSALLAACLAEARILGRTTVWLNTVDPQAERLYTRNGFTCAGVIPRWSQVPWGTWRDSSFWWIVLDQPTS